MEKIRMKAIKVKIKRNWQSFLGVVCGLIVGGSSLCLWAKLFSLAFSVSATNSNLINKWQWVLSLFGLAGIAVAVYLLVLLIFWIINKLGIRWEVDSF
jgi:hypothetical protein